MKLFGTIFPFIETDEHSLVYGRFVANFEFLKALLKYSSFDEFHLFCLNVHHFDLTQKRLQNEILPLFPQLRIRLFLYSHLTHQLQHAQYSVFHLGGWGYFFAGLVYLRNTYSKHLFPITGLIHSLNGLETHYHALKICCAPLEPFDTIICSSLAGQKVLLNIFESIRNTMNLQSYSGKFKGNTVHIPLGVDELFFSVPNKTICRSALQLPQDCRIILSVNRFSPDTKTDMYPLMKCIKKISREIAEPLLFICAGSATPHEINCMNVMLSELDLQSKVKLLPNFDKQYKHLLYGAADIFIGLSDNLQETFGISIIEALSSGCAVIASDFNGYKELVIEGKTGFKIPTIWIDKFSLNELSDIMNFSTLQLMFAQCLSIDLNTLYHRLSKLILDHPLRKQVSDAGREDALQKYHWRTIIKSYENLWDELSTQSITLEKRCAKVMTNPFAYDYLNTFKEYPSSIISEKTVCTLTDDGIDAFTNSQIPTAYADISILMPPEVITNILYILSEKAQTLDEIKKNITHTLQPNVDIPYIVLWMSKYGLISLSN